MFPLRGTQDVGSRPSLTKPTTPFNAWWDMKRGDWMNENLNNGLEITDPKRVLSICWGEQTEENWKNRGFPAQRCETLIISGAGEGNRTLVTGGVV